MVAQFTGPGRSSSSIAADHICAKEKLADARCRLRLPGLQLPTQDEAHPQAGQRGVTRILTGVIGQVFDHVVADCLDVLGLLLDGMFDRVLRRVAIRSGSSHDQSPFVAEDLAAVLIEPKDKTSKKLDSVNTSIKFVGLAIAGHCHCLPQGLQIGLQLALRRLPHFALTYPLVVAEAGASEGGHHSQGRGD